MDNKVVGIFLNDKQAHEFVKRMRSKGYKKEISVITKDTGNKSKGNKEENTALAMGNKDNTDYTQYPILEDRDDNKENLHGLGLAYADTGYLDFDRGKQVDKKLQRPGFVYNDEVYLDIEGRWGDLHRGDLGNEERTTVADYPEENNVATGTMVGGIAGGLTGLALSVGALAIPGIGPIIAAGPLAAVLSSAVVGGLTGALVDWGIPQEQSLDYEKKVEQGRVLVAVECSEDEMSAVSRYFQESGAQEVRFH